jgi:hypothetical protein
MTQKVLDATSEACNRVARHAYSEDIIALAGTYLREFDEFPTEPDDMHDADWYVTHWVLLDIYESGFITKSDYERYEREVDEYRFADFMRCMNGLDCDCE